MNDPENLYDAVAEYRKNHPEPIPQLRCTLHHQSAKLPTRGTPGSAGLDLYAASVGLNELTEVAEYDTGVSVEIPPGYCGLCIPRSSISERPLRMTNSCGLIDSDYRGTIRFRFDVLGNITVGVYKVGERIGQLVIVPYLMLEPVQVEELSETERGTGGFGSTNRANEELKSYTQAVTE